MGSWGLVFYEEYHHEHPQPSSQRRIDRGIDTLVSHASTESTALNACTRAFASSMAAAGSIAPAFKLVRSSEPESAIDDYYTGHEYTFYFQARDQKTGMTVASAKCTV